MKKGYLDLICEIDYKLKIWGTVFIVKHKDGSIKVIGLGEEIK